MAFPRSLALVRGQSKIAESLGAPTMAEDSAPHVRESSGSWLLRLTQFPAGAQVSRDAALQVPALNKALQTYTRAISAFPLREYVGLDETVARDFLRQPTPGLSYSALMARTIQDLLLFDRAYWQVTARSWDGFPSQAARLIPEYVTDPLYPWDRPPVEVDFQVWYNGVPVPPRDLIRFEGDGNGGWLVTGATAINTAAALEAATQNMATIPMPATILKNTGADLPAEQVDALLDAWEEARTNRATAYLNSTIDTKTIGMNPNDLQLVEAREASARAMARLANIDPLFVGAGIPGASLTYTNRVDLYRGLLDLSLTPVMNLVSQRLSMNDVTPRGHTVTFDTSVFLRSNTDQAVALIKEMLPAGVITVNEARDILDLPDLMSIDENPGVI